MPKTYVTPTFKRAVKRLHKSQKEVLDEAVRTILADPSCGESKRGDLAGIQVYKFRMESNLILLAYEQLEGGDTVRLLALGAHENFYRDLKR